MRENEIEVLLCITQKNPDPDRERSKPEMKKTKKNEITITEIRKKTGTKKTFVVSFTTQSINNKFSRNF